MRPPGALSWVLPLVGTHAILLRGARWRQHTVRSSEEAAQLRLQVIPHLAHLLVPLDLGVHEGPQDVRGERQVDVDELRLLVQAVEGEVVSEFHSLDHVLLLHDS